MGSVIHLKVRVLSDVSLALHVMNAANKLVFVALYHCLCNAVSHAY
jgi:hypothetical protein